MYLREAYYGAKLRPTPSARAMEQKSHCMGPGDPESVLLLVAVSAVG